MISKTRARACKVARMSTCFLCPYLNGGGSLHFHLYCVCEVSMCRYFTFTLLLRSPFLAYELVLVAILSFDYKWLRPASSPATLLYILHLILLPSHCHDCFYFITILFISVPFLLLVGYIPAIALANDIKS